MAGLRCRRIRRTYLTILKGHGLHILKRYVLLQPLRPELDGQDLVQIIVTRALSCSHLFTYCTNVHMIRPLCVVHLLSDGVPSREDTFLSWHLAPVSEVTRGLTVPF
jgi:hypothetical protein